MLEDRKLFCSGISIVGEVDVAQMKTENSKSLTCAARELSESYADLAKSLRGTAEEVKAAKKLWRSKNNSMLIKVGLALIAFPDPTISDIVGGLLVAAGTVQAGIRHNTIYVEDIYKTFQETLKDVRNVKLDI